MTRKINKAIYLLIEKYHRLYGLEVYGFNGGHGAGYAGFQVAAERCWDRRNSKATYDDPSGRGRQVLVCYFTHVGIPAWCAGKQLELKDWHTQRTSRIVQWLEQHLTLRELFERYETEISRWRAACSVECSEQYLLMVNLAGLLAARKSDFPRAPGQLFSDMDPEANTKVDHIASRLGGLDPRTDILGISGCLIGRNGKALLGEHVIDVWRMSVQGQSCESIVDFLLDAKESAESELVKKCDSSKAS